MKAHIEKIIKNPIVYANNVPIDVLVKILEKLSHNYYNTSEESIDDETFDNIKDVLQKRDPNNPYLSIVGAPIIGTKNKVILPYEMGSLIKNKEMPISKWITKFIGPYVISDKLDGASAQYYKNNVGKSFLYSRGDGIKGQDISHLLPFLFSSKIIDSLPNGISIRGELVISKKNFKNINNMKNSRNAVAGLVNSKHINDNIAKNTTFVAYGILHPRYLFSDQMEMLKKWKINTVHNTILNKLTDDSLKIYLNDRKKNGEYEIDGIVCGDNSKIYVHKGGYPDYMIAFKIKGDTKLTTVIEVLWEPSMDGYLKPRVNIKPVNIGW
jgi:DNA ligase (NAD+)